MPIIVGIDGSSGDIFPEVSVAGFNIINKNRSKNYDTAFAMSFVSRICKPESVNKKYLRGPTTFGVGLIPAINEGTNFILNRLRMVNEPVLLTGYSRGAAGAICIAKKLHDKQIPVQALLLFDCVDRHALIDAASLPPNVKYAMQVVRNPNTGSRSSFDNSGLRYMPSKTKYEAVLYRCTHGGMGGVPWEPEPWQSWSENVDEIGLGSFTNCNISFEEDERNSKKIWLELKPFMKTHGFYTGA